MNEKDSKEEKLSLKKRLLFFFFPPKCASCGECGWEGLCPRCRERVEKAFSPKQFLARGGNGFADRMLSLFPYEVPEVKRMLLDWKRNDFHDLHLIFGEYLERAAWKKSFYRNIDLVTFAPRRASARRYAGFDQAEQMAKEVSQRLNIPFEPLLSRHGFSRSQHKLPSRLREKNVHGVFRPLRPLHGETVLLIDDIVTTGASARECARILKGCGAMRVYILSLAS